jgi:hypothetical protein
MNAHASTSPHIDHSTTQASLSNIQQESLLSRIDNLFPLLSHILALTPKGLRGSKGLRNECCAQVLAAREVIKHMQHIRKTTIGLTE